MGGPATYPLQSIRGQTVCGPPSPALDRLYPDGSIRLVLARLQKESLLHRLRYKLCRRDKSLSFLAERSPVVYRDFPNTSHGFPGTVQQNYPGLVSSALGQSSRNLLDQCPLPRCEIVDHFG